MGIGVGVGATVGVALGLAEVADAGSTGGRCSDVSDGVDVGACVGSGVSVAGMDVAVGSGGGGSESCAEALDPEPVPCRMLAHHAAKTTMRTSANRIPNATPGELIGVAPASTRWRRRRLGRGSRERTAASLVRSARHRAKNEYGKAQNGFLMVLPPMTACGERGEWVLRHGDRLVRTDFARLR